MKTSKHYHMSPRRPVEGKDAYDMAREWNVSAEEAARRMSAEGWYFCGYNDNGQMSFLSPEEES